MHGRAIGGVIFAKGLRHRVVATKSRTVRSAKRRKNISLTEPRWLRHVCNRHKMIFLLSLRFRNRLYSVNLSHTIARDRRLEGQTHKPRRRRRAHPSSKVFTVCTQQHDLNFAIRWSRNIMSRSNTLSPSFSGYGVIASFHLGRRVFHQLVQDMPRT